MDGSLDQAVVPTIKLADIQTKARSLVDGAVAHSDPDHIFQTLEAGFQAIQTRALETAALAYEAQKRWGEFKLTEDFFDAATIHFGKSRQTLQRYVRAWELLVEKVPAQLQEPMSNKPMKELVAIRQRVAKVGDFTPAEYERIAVSGPGPELRDTLDKLSGRPLRESARLVFVVGKEGTLYARRKGQRVPIGMLKIRPADLRDPFVKEAVDKLITKLEALEE